MIMLLILAPDVLRGEVIEAEIAWLPQWPLSVLFFLDGLGLCFRMILGGGLLITLYARYLPVRAKIRWAVLHLSAALPGRDAGHRDFHNILRSDLWS